MSVWTQISEVAGAVTAVAFAVKTTVETGVLIQEQVKKSQKPQDEKRIIEAKK